MLNKISYAGCLGLSAVISAQFTLKMCTAAKSLKTSKLIILGVQGHSKSSMLTPLKSPSLVLSSMFVPNCAKRAYTGKITTFERGIRI